jgi:gamma-glutamylaminecyclotransferase
MNSSSLRLHKVFVYGTLKKGCPNHHLLNGSPLVATGATAKGYRMFANQFFPMIVRDRNGYKIHGEVYAVPTEVLSRLDALEGHPHHYNRDAVTIIAKDGTKIMAWVYVYCLEILDQKEVTTGNWGNIK